MNQREKILAGGLAVVFAFVIGEWLLSTFLLTPIEERNTRIGALKSSIKKHKATKFKILDAQKKLKEWRTEQSLPPDPLKASTVYQAWLVDLAGKTRLSGARIEPGTGRPVSDTYVKIPMTIQAETTFDRLQQFLYEFHRADLLHKVIRVDCRPKSSAGNPILDLTINVEAISLTDAEDRDELDPKTREPTRPVFDENLFVRGYNGPERQSRPQDMAQYIKLVATFSENGQWTARLYDDTNKEYTVLTPGEDFSIEGVRGNVVSASRDFVRLRIDGRDKEMKLGDTLRELLSKRGDAPAGEPVAEETTAETDKATADPPAGASPETTGPTDTEPAQRRRP